jgi:hypothetical protein
LALTQAGIDMATDDFKAKGYRHLAEECLQEAKNARFDDVREAYEKLAAEWIKLAVANERTPGGPPE